MRPVTPPAPGNLCHTSPTDLRPRSPITSSSRFLRRVSSRRALCSQPVASISHSIPTIIPLAGQLRRASILLRYNPTVVKKSRQTIAEFPLFVIWWATVAVAFTSCGFVSSKTGEPVHARAYSAPDRIKNKVKRPDRKQRHRRLTMQQRRALVAQRFGEQRDDFCH